MNLAGELKSQYLLAEMVHIKFEDLGHLYMHMDSMLCMGVVGVHCHVLWRGEGPGEALYSPHPHPSIVRARAACPNANLHFESTNHGHC